MTIVQFNINLNISSLVYVKCFSQHELNMKIAFLNHPHVSLKYISRSLSKPKQGPHIFPTNLTPLSNGMASKRPKNDSFLPCGLHGGASPDGHPLEWTKVGGRPSSVGVGLDEARIFPTLETFDTGDKPNENFEALELHNGLCANNGTKRIYPEVDQGESSALVFI